MCLPAPICELFYEVSYQLFISWSFRLIYKLTFILELDLEEFQQDAYFCEWSSVETATPFHLCIVSGCRLEKSGQKPYVWLAKSKIFTNLKKNYLPPAVGSASVFPGPAASTLLGTCYKCRFLGLTQRY